MRRVEREKLSHRRSRRDRSGRRGTARVSSNAGDFRSSGCFPCLPAVRPERWFRFEIRKLPPRSFPTIRLQGIDLAFFSAGGEISRRYAPIARAAGAIVIDNSSVFRMEPDVPLVIPEINGEDIRQHSGLIANPNCTTAVALMALYPLHLAFGVQRVFAASYQAVSGSGARAIGELRSQVEAAAAKQTPVAEVYPHPIAFNVLPHVDSFLPGGYTKEEMKMQNEGRRIMHLPEFRASVTCVRVPVYRAHSVAISAEFERPVSVAEAHEALAKAPGLELVDEPQKNSYPMPLYTAGKDNCEVGPRSAGLRAGERSLVLGLRRSTAQGRGAQCGPDRRAALEKTAPDFSGAAQFQIALVA